MFHGSTSSSLPGTTVRTLVVGASGQLGAALVQQLGPAALPAARRELRPDWLPLDLEVLAADPGSLNATLAPHHIAAVFCAAGATDVERCESDPAWASAANHTGPLALARRFRDIPFVFFSTDYVFDGASGPYAEADTPHPLSVYGRSKLDGERAILDAHPAALVLRTTTVYGPDPQAKNFLYTLRRLLSEGKRMRLPSDQLATPTFNADLAAAALALVQRGTTGLVHVAGPDFVSRVELARAACALLGLDASLLDPVLTADLNQRAARPLLGGLRIRKLESLLGPGCMRPIQTGIKHWQSTLETTA